MPRPSTSAGDPPATERRHRDVCLATGTTEEFVPGTFVLVTSFLMQHPAFAGDIVVLHDDLTGASRDALLAVSDQVRLEPASRALRSRVEAVAPVMPDLIGPRRSCFYSLEAFRLAGYRKVLFCDSDLLFQGQVDELFNAREALLAVGDLPWLRGMARDAVRFDWPPRPGAPALPNTFNAGFMLIDRTLTTGECYDGLLDMIVAETWDGVVQAHTDQLLLNRYFAGRQTLLDLIYNYPLPWTREIRRHRSLGPESAKVLHFIGYRKPWQMAQVMGRLEERPPMGAYRRWYSAWMAGIAAVHLRRERLVPPPAGPRADRGGERPATA